MHILLKKKWRNNMNKMTQAALAALVLGATSTAVFAADDAKGVDDRWSGCQEMGCSKDIPIELTVAKKCVISDPKGLVLNTNATNTTTSYTITTNTPYVLNLTTGNANTSNSTYVKNAAGLQIPTVYTTTKTSGSAGPGTPTWGNNNYNGLSADVLSVAAKTVSAVSATQAAGVYKDTYKIRVYY